VVLMLTATVMKRSESLGDLSKEGKQINGLFRLMENELLWFEAYARIYANPGATTKGVNNNTLDGFSSARVAAHLAGKNLRADLLRRLSRISPSTFDAHRVAPD
jgi:hypothetical protein